MRHTKIVATLGPASSSPEVLGLLIKAGMDVARLNCSHASHGDLAIQVENLRRVARLCQRSVAVLLDLSGPKVRTLELEGGEMLLEQGQVLRIVPGEAPGTDDWITCNHPGLAQDVAPGDRILLDDGLMELKVVSVGDEVTTEVLTGGVLLSRKGLNLPDNVVSIPALTEKDRDDLRAGLELGVDYVALSFVQTADDIVQLKALMEELRRPVPIIAKIEKPQAIANLDAILAEVDGIMVARGDLAVEVGNHRVPILQKEILEKSNHYGTLDIVATQMLDSMTHSPRPTRAEASDVANAVLDGCDAVMLSAETATGSYAVQAVEVMDRIAREVEPWMAENANMHMEDGTDRYPAITIAIVRAATQIAASGQFKAIIVFTLSGRTARLLGGFYPKVPILAITPSKECCRAMNLYRGVYPVQMPFPGDSDQMLIEAERILVERGLLQVGDEVVVVAGFTELRGVANMVKVVRV
ncbi:MAG: pyruvate kinase [Deltaproteobacteria bacterium]|nr:pyruvate kinase [Deltaproteobacteria bacterium]